MGEEGELQVNGRGLSRGMTLGYHADLPGGWGEMVVAHESQLFPVDDAMDDRTAARLEPLAVGMHAARGHEAALARKLGASSVVSPGDEAREALVETGAQGYMPIVGDEVYAGGGFPTVVDCVGSRQTIMQSLRFAATRGRVVMLGCAAEIRKLDLTFLWARELAIKGFVVYGREEWRGGHAHTFQVTHDLLLETRAPVSEMVTHVYPLSQVRNALSAAANRRKSGSIKVLLDPSAG
jgi:threonine dehydrogenase-like Zn-dependent dehydrogenase